MKFRQIEDEDVAATIALWERCGLTRPWNDPHKDIAFARGKLNSDVLVAEHDGDIIASVMVGHDGHRGALYYVAVDPDLRGQGLGRATMQAAEAWLKARGVWSINILVRNGNTEVQGFYEALGYEVNQAFSMKRRLKGD
jgi:ribosomal protein S18 acetylase RimI-like enzyme